MNIKLDKITSDTLNKLEKTQKDFWNVPRETGFFLNTIIKIFNAKNVLEIGTSNGYSGIWLAKALKETGGHLTTIEYYEKRQSIAIENFKKCDVYDIITPLQGDACQIISELNTKEKFDVIFMDANKKEYVKYLELIQPHITNKVLILADNIISHLNKVQPFIKAIETLPNFQYEILELPGGLLMAYRN